MARTRILISIHPKYAELIAMGLKSAELRRVRPQVKPGDTILFYATQPIQAVVLSCRIENIVSAPCDELWSYAREKAAISEDDFWSYYKGRRIGHAIFICEVTTPEKPLYLSEIERRWPGFRPPQSYRYVPEEISILNGEEGV